MIIPQNYNRSKNVAMEHNTAISTTTNVYVMSKIRPYKYPQDKTAIKALLFESVKPKTDDFVIYTILAVCANSVFVTQDEYTFEEFFDKFTFLDGSPCGVEEDEE